MNYFLAFVCLCFALISHTFAEQDIVHVNCQNGELKISGPVAQVHSDCSAGLTPESEKNLCEMQCIMKREDLFDDKGFPSPAKYSKYMEKIMSGEILTKAGEVAKSCYDKHFSELKPYAEDKNCDSSKNFNSCMKNNFMGICT